LGWKPKYDLPALVKEMVAADLDYFQNQPVFNKAGIKIR
jgi:GDPmannose 4,6-dehydratase